MTTLKRVLFIVIFALPLISWARTTIDNSGNVFNDSLTCDAPLNVSPLPPDVLALGVNCWNYADSTDTDPVAVESYNLSRVNAACNCLKFNANEDIKERMNRENAYSAATAGLSFSSDQGQVSFNSNFSPSAFGSLSLEEQRERTRAQWEMDRALAYISSYTGLNILGEGKGAMAGLAREHNGSIRDRRMTEEGNTTRSPSSTSLTPRTPQRDGNSKIDSHTRNTQGNRAGTEHSPPDSSVIENLRDRNSEITSNRQCITHADFATFNSAPFDPLVLSELNKPFDQKEWDFVELRRRLSALVALPLPEKRSKKDEYDRLKAKLLFLEKNPIYRNFFSAPAAVPTEDGPIKASIEKVNQNLSSNQAQLYAALQSILPKNKSCFQGNTIQETCQRESYGNFAAYTNTVKDFFDQADLKVYAIYQAKTDMDASSSRIQSAVVAEIKDYDTLISTFQSRTGLSNPDKCFSNKDNLQECLDSYAPFCQLVEANISRLWEKRDPFNDSIDQEMATFRNQNLETNRQFRDFNDRICNTPRRPVGGVGGSKTFFDFKQEYCSRTANKQKEECTTNKASGFALLRNMYQERYRKSRDPNSREGDLAIAGFGQVSASIGDSSSFFDDMVRSSGQSFDRNMSSIYESNKNAGTAFNNTAVPESPIGADAAMASVRQTGTTNTQNAATEELAYSNYVNPLATTQTSTTNDQLSAGQLTEDDKERIRSMAEEEITRNQRQISNASTTSAEREALEAQNKALEQLLAQRSETEAKYQQLIDQLTKRNEDLTQEVATARTATPTAAPARRVAASTGTTLVSPDDLLNDGAVNRAPASTDASRFNTAGAGNGNQAGRGASSFGASGNAAAGGRSTLSGANSALLDAAIARGRVSSDGGAIIVQDAERGVVSAIENASANGPQLSLTVPAQAFTQFQNENVEVLRQYKEQILRSVEDNQAVRLTVRAGDKSMNIVVVNRNGNLVYVPNRVFSLKSLNQQLRLPAGQNP